MFLALHCKSQFVEFFQMKAQSDNTDFQGPKVSPRLTRMSWPVEAASQPSSPSQKSLLGSWDLLGISAVDKTKQLPPIKSKAQHVRFLGPHRMSREALYITNHTAPGQDSTRVSIKISETSHGMFREVPVVKSPRPKSNALLSSQLG